MKRFSSYIVLVLVGLMFFGATEASAQKKMKKEGMMWVSWPKKASKVQTDLSDASIRDFGLANGLVDVKVCAVDDIWTGLKFVYRVKDR